MNWKTEVIDMSAKSAILSYPVVNNLKICKKEPQKFTKFSHIEETYNILVSLPGPGLCYFP